MPAGYAPATAKPAPIASAASRVATDTRPIDRRARIAMKKLTLS
jgi:hypothetical protein